MKSSGNLERKIFGVRLAILRLFPRSNPSLTKTPVPLLFPSPLSTNDVSVSVTRVRKSKDSSCGWSVDEEKLSRLSSHPFQSSLKMTLSPCSRAMNFPPFVTMPISWWPGLFPLPAIPHLSQFLLPDPCFNRGREELTYWNSLGADQKLPFHSKGPGEGFNTCQALSLPTTLHFD